MNDDNATRRLIQAAWDAQAKPDYTPADAVADDATLTRYMPLVKGGQGRTDREVEDMAGVAVMLGLCFGVAAMWLGSAAFMDLLRILG